MKTNLMKQSMKKMTAIAALIAFLSQNMAQAAPILSLAAAGQSEFRHDPARIEIPQDLGEIKTTHRSPETAGLLIHIQDAHGSYEAQRNIVGLIRHLTGRYKVRLLFVEGANEKLDAECFRFFERNDWNVSVADRMMKEGEFTGPEMFLLENTSEARVAAYGVEKAGLYRKDLDLFRNVLRYSDETRTYFDRAKAEIALLQSRIFSNELRDFVKEWMGYLNRRGDLMRYLNVLAEKTESRLGMDLENPSLQLDYPAMARYLKLREIEKKLNWEKAEEEKLRLLAFLKGKVPGRLLRELKKLGPSFNKKAGSKPRFLLEKIDEIVNRRDPAKPSANAARKRVLAFRDYPQFSLAAAYWIFQSEMESEELFRETDLITEKVLGTLAETEAQKELIRLTKDLALMKKLFELTLSRQEYRELSARGEDLTPAHWAHRLEGLRGQSRPARVRPEERLEKRRGEAVKFYQLAERREAFLLERAIQNMRRENENAGILITGGFHAEGVEGLAKAKGLSYVLISPAIRDAGESREVYLRAMLGAKKAIEKSYIDNVKHLFSARGRRVSGALPSSDAVLKRSLAKELHARTVLGKREIDRRVIRLMRGEQGMVVPAATWRKEQRGESPVPVGQEREEAASLGRLVNTIAGWFKKTPARKTARRTLLGVEQLETRVLPAANLWDHAALIAPAPEAKPAVIYSTPVETQAAAPNAFLSGTSLPARGPAGWIRSAFLHSPQFANKATGIITGYYRNILEREPDAPGLAYWVRKAQNGVSFDRIRMGFLHSPEFRNLAETRITGFYRDLLERAPDANGLAYWVRQAQNGVSFGHIRKGFLHSPEFRNLAETKITGFYRTLLEREPDAPGLAYWIRIARRGASFEAIHQAFLRSPEYIRLQAGKVSPGEFQRAETDNGYSVSFYARIHEPSSTVHYFAAVSNSRTGLFEGVAVYPSRGPLFHQATRLHYDSATGELSAVIRGKTETVKVEKQGGAPLADPHIKVTVDTSDPQNNVLVMRTSDPAVSVQERRFDYPKNRLIVRTQVVAGSVLVVFVDGAEVIPNIEYNGNNTRIPLEGYRVASVTEFLPQSQGNYPLGYFEVEMRDIRGERPQRYVIHGPTETIVRNAVSIGIAADDWQRDRVQNYFVADQDGKKVFYAVYAGGRIESFNLNIPVADLNEFSSVDRHRDGTATFFFRTRPAAVVDLATGNEAVPGLFSGSERILTDDGAYTVLVSTPLGPVDMFLAVFKRDTGRFEGVAAYSSPMLGSASSQDIQSLRYDPVTGLLSGVIEQRPVSLPVQTVPEAPLADPYIHLSINTSHPDKDVLVMRTTDPIISGPRERRFDYPKGSLAGVEESTRIVAASVVVTRTNGNIEVIPNIEFNTTGTRIPLEGTELLSVGEYLASLQTNYPLGYFEVKTRAGDTVHSYVIHGPSRAIARHERDAERVPALGEFKRVKTDNGFTILFYSRTVPAGLGIDGNVAWFAEIFRPGGSFEGSAQYLTLRGPAPWTYPLLHEGTAFHYDEQPGNLQGELEVVVDGRKIEHHPVTKTGWLPLEDPYLKVEVDRSLPNKDVLITRTTDPRVTGPKEKRFDYPKDSIQDVKIAAGSVIVDLREGVQILPNVEYNREGKRLDLQGERLVEVADFEYREFYFPGGYNVPSAYFDPMGMLLIQTRTGNKLFTYVVHGPSQVIVNRFEQAFPPEGAERITSSLRNASGFLSYQSYVAQETVGADRKSVFYRVDPTTHRTERYVLNAALPERSSGSAYVSSERRNMDGSVTFMIAPIDRGERWRAVVVDLETGNEIVTPPSLGELDRAKTDNGFTVLYQSHYNTRVSYTLPVAGSDMGQVVTAIVETLAVFDPAGNFVGVGSLLERNFPHEARVLHYDAASGLLTWLIDGVPPQNITVERQARDRLAAQNLRAQIDSSDPLRDVLIVTSSLSGNSAPGPHRYNYAKGTLRDAFVVAGNVVVDTAGGVSVLSNAHYPLAPVTNLEGERVLSVKEFTSDRRTLHSLAFYEVRTQASSTVHTYVMLGGAVVSHKTEAGASLGTSAKLNELVALAGEYARANGRANPFSIIVIAEDVTMKIYHDKDLTLVTLFRDRLEEPDEAASPAPWIERFNQGRLTGAILKKVGAGEARNPAHVVVYTDELWKTAGKALFQQKALEAARKIGHGMQPGDSFLGVWGDDRKHPVIAHLYREAREFRVRDVRKELATAERMRSLLRPLDVPAVSISGLTEKGDIELRLPGGAKVKINVNLLARRGLDMGEAVSLLRQLADNPAKRDEFFRKAGLEPRNGYWLMGGKFLAFLKRVDLEMAAAKLFNQAA
jgi:hypothetical protein